MPGTGIEPGQDGGMSRSQQRTQANEAGWGGAAYCREAKKRVQRKKKNLLSTGAHQWKRGMSRSQQRTQANEAGWGRQPIVGRQKV